MKKGLGVVTLAVLLGLLVGCGLSCPPVEDTSAAQETPGDAGPAATVAPTEIPTLELQPAIIADKVNAVMADPLAQKTWQAAEKGLEIYPDGSVKAESESTALVDVDEGLVRVAPDTTFVYRRPDADTLELELDADGQMWLNVDGLEEGGTVDVKTPSAVASVRGTVFSVRDDGGDIIVSTKVGTVTVSSEAGGEVNVGAGYQTTVSPGAPPSAAVSMTPEEETRWGMAAGPNLQVVMPVVNVVDVFTVTGFASHPQLSPAGDYLAISNYAPGMTTDRWIVYDVEAGEFYTDTFPSGTADVNFNPVTGQMVYVVQEYPSRICIAEVDDPAADCLIWDGYYFYQLPVWSPDGEWLVFSARYEGIDATNLYKARPDGSDLVPLTSDGFGYNGYSAWSPDGNQIAYVFYENYDQPGELRVMGADGSSPQTVLTMTQQFDFPAWSPDGSMLAMPGYVDHETGEGGGLWIVSFDSAAPALVPGTADWGCYEPAWSPTETGWPLFFSGYSPQDEKRGVYWYMPTGDAWPVYFSYASWGPVWSADGTRVTFGHGFGSGPDDAWTDVYIYETDYKLLTTSSEP